VGGVDRPRIVQVGYNSQFLERLQAQVGLPRLIGNLAGDANVAALHAVDLNMDTIAYNSVPGREAGEHLSDADIAVVRRVIERNQTVSHLSSDILTVIAPMENSATGRPFGAVRVQLSIEHILDAVRRQVGLASLVAATILGLGVLTSLLLARRVTQPVARLTAAAAAVEAGAFEPETLGSVVERQDELGQLARVFQRMAQEVHAREERLQQEVQALRIEVDQSKREREVAQITESAFFRDLQDKVRQRRPRSDGPPASGEPISS
jgi:HAMP domain-containing protein